MDAKNPAMTLQLTIESQWRRVSDPGRSAEVLTADFADFADDVGICFIIRAIRVIRGIESCGSYEADCHQRPGSGRASVEHGTPNHSLHRTAAERFGLDAAALSDAGFAASARFRGGR